GSSARRDCRSAQVFGPRRIFHREGGTGELVDAGRRERYGGSVSARPAHLVGPKGTFGPHPNPGASLGREPQTRLGPPYVSRASGSILGRRFREARFRAAERWGKGTPARSGPSGGSPPSRLTFRLVYATGGEPRPDARAPCRGALLDGQRTHWRAASVGRRVGH